MKGNKCANCGKGVMYGHNVSHAKNRTRRIFKPNLHQARVLMGTTRRKLKLCTKCLREFRVMEKAFLSARTTQESLAPQS